MRAVETGPRLAIARGVERREQPGVVPAEAMRRFRAEVLPHLDAAYNHARYLARDSDLAEDIVQDAFVRAIRGFAGWRGENAKAWLLAIVRGAFLDAVRSRGRAAATLMSEHALSPAQVAGLENIADPEQPTPEDLVTNAEAADRVRAMIERLPEPFRETLVLREMEDMSYRDIAQATATRIGTVMSRLARARDMLKVLLGAGFAEPVAGREARP